MNRGAVKRSVRGPRAVSNQKGGVMRKLNLATIRSCLAVFIVAVFPQLSNAATIYGCASKMLGVVRIVNRSTQCDTRLEIPISWNSAGSAGSTGLTGAAGPVGPAGPAGPTGATGPAGPVAVYGNVAIVALSGGNYTDPVSAMKNVATWCGTPSATNPCLLKIMPGVYDLAGGSLTMQPYVDIEGSGEQATTISSTINGDVFPPNAVVKGADNAEIRFLTVRCAASTGMYNVAILNRSHSPKISHVTAIVLGAGTSLAPIGNYGVYNQSSSTSMNDVTVTATATTPGVGTTNRGVFNFNSSPNMSNVTATSSGNEASNTGVENVNSSTSMNNVTAIASGDSAGNFAIINQDSTTTMTNVTARALGAVNAVNRGMLCSGTVSIFTVLVDRSTFEGSTNSISNAGCSLLIGSSKLMGSVGTVGPTPAYTCAFSYNENYVALGTNCQ